MANLIRRNEPQQQIIPTWEPLRIMRELMGWDPFAEMLPSWNREAMEFAPRFEVKETKDAYVFKADLPGVAEKDLDITLTGNRLTVAGKREEEKREEGDTYYAFERNYGTFTRAFTLPEGADLEHVDAELKNGVLTISLAKKPEHQPKKISLKGIGEKVRNVLVGKEKPQS